MAEQSDTGLASLIPALLKSLDHTIGAEIACEVSSANGKVMVENSNGKMMVEKQMQLNFQLNNHSSWVKQKNQILLAVTQYQPVCISDIEAQSLVQIHELPKGTYYLDKAVLLYIHLLFIYLRLKNYGNIKLENSHCGNFMVEMEVVSAIKLMSS